MYRHLFSLWDRVKPGQDPIGRHIRYHQWTMVSLTKEEQAAGMIPLRHIAAILTYGQPDGPTTIRCGPQTYPGRKEGQRLHLAPGLLPSRIVALRQYGEGYAMTWARPNLIATQHCIRSLLAAGWDMGQDPFDADGQVVLPALIRATAQDGALRREPTLPLDLVQTLSCERLEARYR